MKNFTFEKLLNLIKRNWGWKFVFRFFTYFFFIFGVMAGVTYLLYAQELKGLWEDIKREDESQVALHHDLLINQLQMALSDILFIKEVPALKNFLNSPGVKTISDLEKVILALGENRSLYYQIRYINENGQEIIRIDFNKSSSIVTPSSALENVASQEIFLETVKLRKNEVYISQFNLETYKGELINPYQPTIRFATPVVDAQDNPRGIMVLNYKGNIILDTLIRYKRIHADGGSAFLLNSDSYYLYNQNQPNSAWGFQRPEWKSFRLDQNYPEVWGNVIKTDDGQFFTEDGLFTFTTFWPTEAEYTTFSKASTPEVQHQPKFKLVFFYPYYKFNQVSQENTYNFNVFMFISGAAAIFFSFTFAWGSLELAHQQKLLKHSALHDSLTGLPNRNLFKDRLFQSMLMSKRTQGMVALYFIDLDGFKEINDSYGHDAGDAILKHVSASLLSALRETDTLARLGGDEFCAICSGFRNKEEVELLGKRMVHATALPLNYHGVLMNVTGSIGIAIQTSVDLSGDDLIKSADNAMYLAKEKGKNQYFIVDPLPPVFDRKQE